tara:strand:- start:3927 stop:5462 length:1536 start_codon:yes stop_codon:yes gene_type:complete
MKKTISINIKGINFIIEEDAYELLQNYLERLSNTLKDEDGSQEIIEDVELRIAEICSSKLIDSKTVIDYSDIQEILATLGNPEDYIDSEENNGPASTDFSDKNRRTDRRLFRDKENATIAGVCSGISNFFNIDVVIIRAIFVVFFLFAGFGFPLYIILWIIVPQTKSSIDRLRMKGKPITVETVREEVEIAAEKLKEGSKKFANRIRKDDSYKKSVNRGGRILSSLLGIIFVGIGMAFLVLLIIFGIAETQIFPIQGSDGFLSLPDLGSLVLLDNGDYELFWWGAILLNSAVVLFFVLLGSILLFKIYNTWSKITLLFLFITGVSGLLMCAAVGMRTGRDFMITGELDYEVGSVYSETLVIEPELESLMIEGDYTVKSNGKYHLMKVGKDDITFHGITIYYSESKDSLFHIRQNFKVQSQSHEIAIEKCKNIKHMTSLENDTLTMSSAYSFPKTDKIRAQAVQIEIEIPKGAQVIIDGEVISITESSKNHKNSDHYEHGKMTHDGKYYHWD